MQKGERERKNVDLKPKEISYKDLWLVCSRSFEINRQQT